MFAEFAVEPAAMVTSVDRFVGLIDRFGVDQGRIISDFAQGRWSGEVIELAKANGFRDVALASVEERLREKRNEKGIARFGRAYPGKAGGWTPNALEADKIEPFAGIVLEAKCGHALEICAAEARTDRSPLRIPDIADVPRTAGDIVAAVKPLIRISRTLHLIDPHIGFSPRWLNSIRALILACRAPMEVVVHTWLSAGDMLTPAQFEQNVRHYYKVFPAGVRVTFRRWKKRPGGQEFHDRAILSDVGGMTFGHGLDEGAAGTTVHVHRLGRDGWETLLAKFTPESSPYDSDPPITLQQAGAA
ncbi:hypothetical protein ACFQPG_07295 [Sphingomonas sp. GCM10030256]|uniref:hypothetical protein n=1 Tax=Sphingomonas sp. GCM10030256 TaxID=3273427 RepID=UPI0036119D72